MLVEILAQQRFEKKQEKYMVEPCSQQDSDNVVRKLRGGGTVSVGFQKGT